MAEELKIPVVTDRAEIYRTLLPQLKALTEGEEDSVANLANVVAALRQSFGFFWVGVYRVIGDELVLGPFQGPIACTRIAKGKGVCGQAWEQNKTLVVADVDAFPGHIACSSASRSEIVVPVTNKAGEVILIIDVDSEHLDDFDAIDERYLNEIAELLSVLLES